MDDFVALQIECDAAAALFRQGFRCLQDYRFALTDAEPLFVCWAGGAEKLLKLTIGLSRLSHGREWPTKEEMRRKYGHDLVALNNAVVEIIESDKARSTVEPYLMRLCASTKDDKTLSALLTALSRYAVNGRFYNLDHLAGQAQPEPSPRQLLEAVHRSILSTDHSLLADLDHLVPRLNAVISVSMAGWCELIIRAWITGICGEDVRKWGHGFAYQDS